MQAAEGGTRIRSEVHPDVLVLYNIYLNDGCDRNSVPAVCRKLTPGLSGKTATQSNWYTTF